MISDYDGRRATEAFARLTQVKETHKARMDTLRMGMQDALDAARASKQAGRLDFAKHEHRAVRLMLEYIANGYITRLWNDLQEQRS